MLMIQNLLKQVWPIFTFGGIIFFIWISFFLGGSSNEISNNEIIAPRILVEIPSNAYPKPQKAYLYHAGEGQPLIISLHTWGGGYDQYDSLFYVAQSMNWNYIHPDIGGPLWNPESCCFPASVQSIDEAIDFALKETKADTSKIVVIGKSGGGTAVLGAYLHSKYDIAHYMCWAPITDFVSWHDEVLLDTTLSRKYLARINLGTGSETFFDTLMAKKKSPFYAEFPKLEDLKQKHLIIYTGIYDGTNGWPTSIEQPIRFYNKLMNHFQNTDSSSYISSNELNFWLKYRKPLLTREFIPIGDRKCLASKSYQNTAFQLFDGGHEIRYQEVIKQLKSIQF
jgi:hypothetical protein